VPLRFADVVLYLLAAAIPLVLLTLFSLFRWRYLRAVERAIHAEAPTADFSSEPSPRGLSHEPLILVSEHPAAGRIPAGPGLLVARREEAAYRTALALSGLLFVTLATLLIWWGRRDLGARAAVSVAYWCTLPGILLVAVFVRRAWIAAIGAVTIWLAVGFLLHLVWLRISVSNTLGLLPGTMEFVGPLTLMVGLLALRATRPILVGLVPLVLMWLVTLVAGAAALDAFGITINSRGFTSRAIAGGLLANLLGIGLAVWQIRRGLPKGSLILLIGLTLGGALLGSVDGLSIFSGIVTVVGLYGLLTVATWWLFERFVRFRANGHLPDEVLHYGFGWLGLAVFLPPYAGQVAWQWVVLLPFVSFGVTLHQLLRRLRLRAATRVPGRLLLLRPFNEGRLRSNLLDALDNSWRRIGTLELVVGGDLAVRTVSGPVLESVLLGTVHRHFLRRLDEVDDRLARLPRRVALDGRFPLNEMYCDPAVWQATVTALADAADVVLMDLRGMRARNRGALFELRMAVQRVELSRIVLLVDRHTDERALAQVAEEAWRARPESLPGRIDVDPRLVVLRCTGRIARDNAWIVEKVFAAHEDGPGRLPRGGI
jgi:hypothetical protein